MSLYFLTFKYIKTTKKFLSVLVLGLLMGAVSYPILFGEVKAGIFPWRKKKVVAAVCAGTGSCVVSVDGGSHTDDQALDEVVFDDGSSATF